MSGRTVGVGRQPFRCCLEGLLRNQGRVGPLHLQRGSLSPPFWVPSEGTQIDRAGQIYFTRRLSKGLPRWVSTPSCRVHRAKAAMDSPAKKR